MKYTQEDINLIEEKFDNIKAFLNEKERRIWCASEANCYGYGGISLVSKATGMAPNTIKKGKKELENGTLLEGTRSRAIGGGRKKASEKQRGLRKALLTMIAASTKGDPESLLLWTSKSLRNIADALAKQGFNISHSTVAVLLKKYRYSLQVNKKSLEGSSHPDRDAQFQYINSSVATLQQQEQPVISVDTKKKENLGNFKNNGAELCEKGKPVKVSDHDFPDKRLGRVVPYGIYNIGENSGWVSVGVSSDTAEFAVNAIRTWWYTMGLKRYPDAKDLLITADCGGSNGYRTKLWKYELNKFADESGLRIHVRHFPPGTSKWNSIEHKLFSYISKNWRGRPLLTRETVVNLISNTKTKRGLKIAAVLDENEYESGKGDKLSDEEIGSINICGDDFHPEWNYTISPRKMRQKIYETECNKKPS